MPMYPIKDSPHNSKQILRSCKGKNFLALQMPAKGTRGKKQKALALLTVSHFHAEGAVLIVLFIAKTAERFFS